MYLGEGTTEGKGHLHHIRWRVRSTNVTSRCWHQPRQPRSLSGRVCRLPLSKVFLSFSFHTVLFEGKSLRQPVLRKVSCAPS